MGRVFRNYFYEEMTFDQNEVRKIFLVSRSKFQIKRRTSAVVMRWECAQNVQGASGRTMLLE